MDADWMKAWQQWMQTAVQQGLSAQEAMQRFAQLAPGTSSAAPTGPPEEWLELWYRSMGVVPRARYLEALERCEVLRTKLEEAEATIRRLRREEPSALEADAEEALAVLNNTLTNTLKAQADWMRAFTGAEGPGSDAKTGES